MHDDRAFLTDPTFFRPADFTYTADRNQGSCSTPGPGYGPKAAF